MTRQYEATETRRRQVAEAALHTIAEDGVARFTTRAVAARVGISDGTLFRHFGSKEEVVLEAMSLLEQQIDASLVTTGDARADLEAFFRHRATFVGASGSVGRLIFSDELVHLAGERGRAVVGAWRQRSVGFLLDCLSSLRAAGQVRDDLEISAMSTLIQGVLLTFAMQASLGRAGTASDLQERVDASWSMVQTVLASPT